MLDFNHRASCGVLVTRLVDAGLEAEHQSAPPRNYLGALRIFGAGPLFENLAACWLRSAGFDLYTRAAR